MASDGLFLMILSPLGLFILTIGISLPFLFWRIILGPTFARIGFKPLVIGYLLAAVGLVFYTFLYAYLEYNDRVSKQILSEVDRWSVIPHWTIYISVLSLIFVVPLLGFVAAPISAGLLRFSRFSFKNICFLFMASLILIALMFWFEPGNEWSQTHRLEEFGLWLRELVPAFICVGMPFVFGIYRQVYSS